MQLWAGVPGVLYVELPGATILAAVDDPAIENLENSPHDDWPHDKPPHDNLPFDNLPLVHQLHNNPSHDNQP
jgi:hypothetical protein